MDILFNTFKWIIKNIFHNSNPKIKYYTVALPFILLIILTACEPVPTEQPVIPTVTSEPTSSSYTFLDFDHPRLHEIAGDNPLIIDEIVRTRRYQEPAYVAVIVETGDPIEKQKMLLFKLEKPSAVLLYESEPYYFMSFILLSVDPAWLIDNTNYYYYRAIVGGIAQFGSSYLEIPMRVSNGGNCYDCSGMKIISINENYTVKDITPKTTFRAKTFIDITGQMNFVIVATQYYESSYGAKSRAGSPYAFRLFAWDGTEYVDVSKNEIEFYDQKIGEFEQRIQDTYSQPLNSGIVMPLLADIFFAYESSGRIDFGWEQINSFGDLKNWDIKNTTSEEIQSYHEVFDLLEQRYKQAAQ